MDLSGLLCCFPCSPENHGVRCGYRTSVAFIRVQSWQPAHTQSPSMELDSSGCSAPVSRRHYPIYSKTLPCVLLPGAGESTQCCRSARAIGRRALRRSGCFRQTGVAVTKDRDRVDKRRPLPLVTCAWLGRYHLRGGSSHTRRRGGGSGTKGHMRGRKPSGSSEFAFAKRMIHHFANLPSAVWAVPPSDTCRHGR